MHVNPHDHTALCPIPSTGITIQLFDSLVHINHSESGQLLHIIHLHARGEGKGRLEIQLSLCEKTHSHVGSLEGIPYDEILGMNIVTPTACERVSQDGKQSTFPRRIDQHLNGATNTSRTRIQITIASIVERDQPTEIYRR